MKMIALYAGMEESSSYATKMDALKATMLTAWNFPKNLTGDGFVHGTSVTNAAKMRPSSAVSVPTLSARFMPRTR